MYKKEFVSVIYVMFVILCQVWGDDEKAKTKKKPIYPCAENTHYDECGPDCIPSCAQIFNEVPMNCTANCVRGCFCNIGFIYDETQKKCVNPDDCVKVQCQENEYFSACGTHCGKICGPDSGASCDKKCEVGCFCKEGFLRSNNQCIKPKDCDAKCKKNEEYLECGSKCPTTCKNWADQHFTCPDDECLEGCFCKSGYALDAETKTCISIKDCKEAPECPKNSYFAFQGQDCLTCTNYQHTECFGEYAPKCYCNEGFVRNANNECVSVEECNDDNCQSEDINSMFTDCAVCLPTCQRQKNYLCPPECATGCKCKSGYIKDEVSDKCVTLEECADLLEKSGKLKNSEDDEDFQRPESFDFKIEL